jgi:DNA-binding response OmpR family regulator
VCIGGGFLNKILIIDHDDELINQMKSELEHDNDQVTTCSDERNGLELALSNQNWDLILLDVHLPELNGFEILRRIRQSNEFVPIIIISSRDSLLERIMGLDQGANDYITKPFAMEELLARIRNAIRQHAKLQMIQQSSIYREQDLVLNLKSREVFRQNQLILLTPKEFDLLRYLIQYKNEIRTREQIISEVWGYDFLGDTNVVDVYIRYLRLKIDKGFPTKYIHTVRGFGYLFRTHSSHE